MTKKEQLKVAFRAIVFNLLDKVVAPNRLLTGSIAVDLDETTNLLLKEVSIRTDLR